MTKGKLYIVSNQDNTKKKHEIKETRIYELGPLFIWFLPFSSVAKDDESVLLSCKSATVSQVVWFFDALKCFSASDSIFNAFLNFCISSSAIYSRTVYDKE